MKKLMQSCLLFFITFSFFSCASKKIDYPTYNNSSKIKSGKSRSATTSGLRDLKNIPGFNHRRGLMAPGFLFTLFHASDDKLQGKFRANYNGNLRLPYGVRINVNGKTFSQLKKEVHRSYKKFFQKGVANVTFKIKARQYFVDVRGFVKKPGRYLVTRKESLHKVIDKAGGLNGDIKNELFSVSLKQQRQAYSISLNQYQQSDVYGNAFTWTGGDSVFVKTQSDIGGGKSLPVVTVLGGVRNPGKSLFAPGENIFYYLSKNGGTQDYLGFEESYIIRETDKGLTKIQFNLTKMETIPQIYPNDIIMLNSEKRTKTDKVLDRTSQISSILSTIALLILAL